MIATTIFLGIVVWLGTTILVESELCKPLREAVERWAGPAAIPERTRWNTPSSKFTEPAIPAPHPVRLKLAYLIHCHLCAGTWVGLLVAAATPYRPLDAALPLGEWLLAGLLYKGIAHLILAVNNTLRRYS